MRVGYSPYELLVIYLCLYCNSGTRSQCRKISQGQYLQEVAQVVKRTLKVPPCVTWTVKIHCDFNGYNWPQTHKRVHISSHICTFTRNHICTHTYYTIYYLIFLSNDSSLYTLPSSSWSQQHHMWCNRSS